MIRTYAIGQLVDHAMEPSNYEDQALREARQASSRAALEVLSTHIRAEDLRRHLLNLGEEGLKKLAVPDNEDQNSPGRKLICFACGQRTLADLDATISEEEKDFLKKLCN